MTDATAPTAPAAPAAPGADGAPLFVGRARELGVLRERLAAALAGRGSLVLVGGEAGIGKTALAETLCREGAARGTLVLVGRSYDLAETPPYGPWREAFAGYAPARARANGPPAPPAAFTGGGAAAPVASRETLFAQVGDFLAGVAGRQPLVLLLDDLHWADPASLELLRALARQLATRCILLLATYRADELTRRHPLAALLPLLAREAAALCLDLPPLTPADLRALVGARYGLAASDATRLTTFLHERADGNPFFVHEVLHTLEADGALRRDPAGGRAWTLGEPRLTKLPTLLRQALEGRLDRLGEETRGLLAVAAVIGQEVPLDLWLAICGAREQVALDVLGRAIEARVLEETTDGAGLRFVHALIRQALYEGLLLPRRRAWHRRVGEALSMRGNADPDAVAYHYRQAGDSRAVAWLVRAGERAERAHAWRTAADRFDAALALLGHEAAGARERGWLLFRRAWLRRFIDRFADSQPGLAALEEAATLATVAADRSLAAVSRFARGFLLALDGDLRRGLAELEAGVAALDGLRNQERARAEAILAVPPDRHGYRGAPVRWLAYVGRYAEAVALVERLAAGDAAEEVAYSLAFGSGLVYAAWGRPAEARRAFARARALARAGDQPFYLAQAAWQELEYAVLPYQADSLAERRALAAAGEQAWARANATQAEIIPRIAHLPLLRVEGQWLELRELAARAPQWVLDLPARDRGEPAAAWAAIEAVLPAGPATEPGDTYYLNALGLQRLAATLALDAGDLPAAREWLEAHDRWLAWARAVLGQAEGALDWAAYYRAAGEAARARQHAEQALTHATEPRQPLALLAAYRLLGELDTSAGHHTDAAAHLDRALALAEACEAPYERALTLLALARLRAGTPFGPGDRADALALLDEVRAICAPLDARLALARADAMARQLGAALVRPLVVVPPGGALPDGLSGREAEVLRLIAAGLSNREMASALYLSRRTVERHIENLYRKIGAHNKADATAYALRHQLA